MRKRTHDIQDNTQVVLSVCSGFQSNQGEGARGAWEQATGGSEAGQGLVRTGLYEVQVPPRETARANATSWKAIARPGASRSWGESRNPSRAGEQAGGGRGDTESQPRRGWVVQQGTACVAVCGNVCSPNGLVWSGGNAGW
ncbi:hypothetical protein CKAH01_13001 [Colletotrichum kahawae]|uniref:Uncharacterized protein n=1 Tax=Colletotrichum kahawae TaxID=34407 RepID=A0AAE0DBP8_COLKA|nr:hypothetical protein CKAH01_13001 [Colletotrichum kahawae]